jgi:hypothetical protein
MKRAVLSRTPIGANELVITLDARDRVDASTRLLEACISLPRTD